MLRSTDLPAGAAAASGGLFPGGCAEIALALGAQASRLRERSTPGNLLADRARRGDASFIEMTGRNSGPLEAQGLEEH